MILRILITAIFALLTACAGQPPAPSSTKPSTAWQAMQPKLEAIDHWRFTGKLGIVQPKRADSAVINAWEQNGETYRINLSSAVLGLGQVEIEGDPHFLVFREAGEPDRYTDEPESLIETETGWKLPVRNLRYWVLGLSAPGEPAVTLYDAQGFPGTIRQAGWTIHIAEFTAAENDPAILIARRLTLEREDVRVKVIIKTWTRLDRVSPPT